MERRLTERRKPTIVMEYAEGLAFIKICAFTGEYRVHAIEGVNKRIEIPNPQGWGVPDEVPK